MLMLNNLFVLLILLKNLRHKTFFFVPEKIIYDRLASKIFIMVMKVKQFLITHFSLAFLLYLCLQYQIILICILY